MKVMENKAIIDLEQEYLEVMKDATVLPTRVLSWEKVGDLYKQFSLYDYSKYTTSIIGCFKQIFFYAAINHEKRWIDFCKR